MSKSTHITTICALSTAPSMAAIGVLRLSGPQAISITEQCFSKALHDKKEYTTHVGTIHKNGKILDEVVVNLFRAPHSYTSEDVVEISCHGSVFILQEVLNLLLEKGAMQNNLPGGLIAMDIRATIHYLGEITGTISTEDLLGNIFSKFCIGK